MKTKLKTTQKTELVEEVIKTIMTVSHMFKKLEKRLTKQRHERCKKKTQMKFLEIKNYRVRMKTYTE